MLPRQITVPQSVLFFGCAGLLSLPPIHSPRTSERHTSLVCRPLPAHTRALVTGHNRMAFRRTRVGLSVWVPQRAFSLKVEERFIPCSPPGPTPIGTYSFPRLQNKDGASVLGWCTPEDLFCTTCLRKEHLHILLCRVPFGWAGYLKRRYRKRSSEADFLLRRACI